MKDKLLASSPTLPGVTKLISEYFCGSTIELKLNYETQRWDISNRNGLIKRYYVTVKGKRVRFYREGTT